MAILQLTQKSHIEHHTGIFTWRKAALLLASTIGSISLLVIGTLGIVDEYEGVHSLGNILSKGGFCLLAAGGGVGAYVTGVVASCLSYKDMKVTQRSKEALLKGRVHSCYRRYVGGLAAEARSQFSEEEKYIYIEGREGKVFKTKIRGIFIFSKQEMTLHIFSNQTVFDRYIQEVVMPLLQKNYILFQPKKDVELHLEQNVNTLFSVRR